MKKRINCCTIYLKGHSLDSVSFMGMGEPLANPYIFDALRILTDKTAKRFEALKPGHVKRFGDTLKSAGIGVAVRAQFDTDIGAACGQLYGSG